MKDKRIAVLKTIEMWKWLRDNPDKNKNDYFREHNIPLSLILGGCYLCEVWRNDNCWFYKKCSCPLSTAKLQCDIGTDPPWIEYLKDNRYRSATRIISACKRWLKKHEEE